MADSARPADIERLREFTDGTAGNLIELIDLYIDQTAIYLGELSTAIDAGVVESIRRIAQNASSSHSEMGRPNHMPRARNTTPSHTSAPMTPQHVRYRGSARRSLRQSSLARPET